MQCRVARDVGCLCLLDLQRGASVEVAGGHRVGVLSIARVGRDAGAGVALDREHPESLLGRRTVVHEHDIVRVRDHEFAGGKHCCPAHPARGPPPPPPRRKTRRRRWKTRRPRRDLQHPAVEEGTRVQIHGPVQHQVPAEGTAAAVQRRAGAVGHVRGHARGHEGQGGGRKHLRGVAGTAGRVVHEGQD